MGKLVRTCRRDGAAALVAAMMVVAFALAAQAPVPAAFADEPAEPVDGAQVANPAGDEPQPADEPDGPAGVLGFDDVAETDWVYAQGWLERVVGTGLMTGTAPGRFSPQGTLSKAQVATILYRASVPESVETTDPSRYAQQNTTGLSDVLPGRYYTAAVNWAHANGIVTGSGGAFHPGAAVTRQQLATMVYRWLTAYLGQPPQFASLGSFSDRQRVGTWAEDAVSYCVSTSILGGSNGRLSPEGTATRAQMAKVISQALDAASRSWDAVSNLDVWLYDNDYGSADRGVDKKTVRAYDVTGDRVPDTLTLWQTGFDPYHDASTNLDVYVNGERALSLHVEYALGCRAKLMRLANGTPLLLVQYYSNNMDGVHAVYQYRGGRFKQVMSSADLPHDTHCSIESAQADGMDLQVRVSTMNFAVGVMTVDYTYRVRDGVVPTSSLDTSDFAYNRSWSGGWVLDQGWLTTAYPFQTYTAPGAGATSFYAGTGTRVQVTQLAVRSGDLWFKAVAASGAEGWFRTPRTLPYPEGHSGTMFQETTLAG